MNPLVSYYTTVLRPDEKLRRTHASLARGGVPWELVVTVAHGFDTVFDFLPRDTANLKVLSTPGAGISEGFNAALAQCTGQYLMVANAGDLILDVRPLVAALERDATLDVAYGDFLMGGRGTPGSAGVSPAPSASGGKIGSQAGGTSALPDEGQVTSSVRPSPPLRGGEGVEPVGGRLVKARPGPLTKWDWLTHAMCFCHGAALTRPDFHRRFGLYDPRYTATMDFAVYLSAVCAGARMSYAPGAVAEIEGSGVSSRVLARTRENYRVIREHVSWPVAFPIACKWWLASRLFGR